MPNIKGYMVVGAYGVMALSRQVPGLVFAKDRGRLATIFVTKGKAQSAIRVTEKNRQAAYPDEEPWMKMRIVRLESPNA